MTDQEINRSLALAIGWPAERVHIGVNLIYISTAVTTLRQVATWHTFDYRDPAVIWPIAERHNRFPYALRDQSGAFTGRWNILTDGVDYSADSAAKAVALAVIGRWK